jgi:hypothetical protein
MTGGTRPSFGDSLRALNRLPFVLGVLALVASGLALIGLGLGGERRWWWDSRPSLALVAVAIAGLGVVLITLYYRLRD